MPRVPIPRSVATDVLYESNRTCCVCAIPGKSLQLHHIDGDHANSVADNLAALCLECHDKTQLSGGFGRQLDADQVRRFKAEWLARVRVRREQADATAISAMTGVAPSTARPAISPGLPIADYAALILTIRQRAYEKAKPEWDSGVTASMVAATYGVIDILGDVLCSLATFYPEGHFERENPRDYISELIATRFSWHWYRHEPDGHGNNGTIARTMVAGSVLGDVERMIEEMVGSLSLDWSGETDTFSEWREKWRQIAFVDVQGVRAADANETPTAS